jgi:virulence factor
MRVAVVGLGSIARKAYLPVVTSLPGVTPVLVSRTASSLASVGDTYRVADRYGSVAEAIGAGLDAALVHTTSASHPEVVATLLRAGVPVLVDKPLALDLASAQELVALAGGVSLMVGFNRRYAPAYRAFAGWSDRDVVSLQKHRSHEPGPVRQMVFDDFIHVIDTLRYLVPSPLDDLVTTAHVDDLGRCRRLSVQFTGEGRLATGVMSWTAGDAHEVLDVIGDGRRRQVIDLADVVDIADGERLSRRDGWLSPTVHRGFVAMCEEFLGAVRAGRLLDASDALVTHEVCELVVARAAVTTSSLPAGPGTSDPPQIPSSSRTGSRDRTS